MIKGRLRYIAREDRFFVIDDKNNDYCALHCGNVLEIYVYGQWRKTSIEGWGPPGIEAWYLVGTRFQGRSMQGLPARIGF